MVIRANSLVANSWYSTKPMIRTALEVGVTMVLRMEERDDEVSKEDILASTNC